MGAFLVLTQHAPSVLDTWFLSPNLKRKKDREGLYNPTHEKERQNDTANERPSCRLFTQVAWYQKRLLDFAFDYCGANLGVLRSGKALPFFTCSPNCLNRLFHAVLIRT